MPILTLHTVILTFLKIQLSLSPLTGQLLLKNPDQYLEEEEEEEEEMKKKKKKKNGLVITNVHFIYFMIRSIWDRFNLGNL